MLLDYLFFLAKTLTLGILALFFIAGVLWLIARARSGGTDEGGQISISSISEDLEELEDLLEKETYSKAERKALHKARKKEKSTASSEDHPGRLFVLRFDGDVEASAADDLRESISAVLLTATEKDEVLVVIDSEGGYVHRYGFAASQLERIRARNIRLSAAIDTVGASGGYMMACVAHHIVAAPFAIVGSIGVIAELPNFHRVLEKYDVEYDQFTAGEYKATLSKYAKNTTKGREKFQAEINDTHTLFKSHLARYRPFVDVDAVATGEHWHAAQALDNRLVDALMTSDDYILAAYHAGRPIFDVSYTLHKPVLDRLIDRIYGYCAPALQALQGLRKIA